MNNDIEVFLAVAVTLLCAGKSQETIIKYPQLRDIALF